MFFELISELHSLADRRCLCERNFRRNQMERI